MLVIYNNRPFHSINNAWKAALPEDAIYPKEADNNNNVELHMSRCVSASSLINP